jgi:hypothetical protein
MSGVDDVSAKLQQLSTLKEGSPEWNKVYEELKASSDQLTPDERLQLTQSGNGQACTRATVLAEKAQADDHPDQADKLYKIAKNLEGGRSLRDFFVGGPVINRTV